MSARITRRQAVDLPTLAGRTVGYLLLALVAGSVAAIPLLCVAWWVL